MMKVISALKGFGIFAKDGRLGSVADFLFDDSDWKVRWLVVECGDWRKGRKVLIHPSAVSDTRLEEQRFEVKLTMAEVADSPQWDTDLPVSQQMEEQLYSYYGWDPSGRALSGRNARRHGFTSFGSPVSGPSHPRGQLARCGEPDISGHPPQKFRRDRRLSHPRHRRRDRARRKLHAGRRRLEPSIFHRRHEQLVVWTRVLIAPSAVVGIDWFDRHVRLNVSRGQVERVRSGTRWSRSIKSTPSASIITMVGPDRKPDAC